MFKNILHTEWLKVKNYRAFWLLLSVTAISYPGINTIFYLSYDEVTNPKGTGARAKMAKLLLGNPFKYPEVLHTTAFLSSFFTFIPAIVIIMLITNEYMFKTHRQNIIDGWKKSSFIWGKFISVVLVTLIVTFFYVIVAFSLGNMVSDTAAKEKMFEQVNYIPLFALQVFAQLSIAFFMGLIIRKAFIAYGIYIFYSFIAENILGGFLKWKAKTYGVDYGQFLPFEMSDRLIPIPGFLGKFNEVDYKLSLAAVDKHIVYTLILTTIVWLFSFYIFKRKDL